MDYSKDTQIILKKDTFFYLSIRMSGKSMNVGGKKIKKSNFYKNKKIFKIDNIDCNKIFISEKEPCAEKKSTKYLIGCNDKDVIRALCNNASSNDWVC